MTFYTGGFVDPAPGVYDVHRDAIVEDPRLRWWDDAPEAEGDRPRIVVNIRVADDVVRAILCAATVPRLSLPSRSTS